MSSLFMLEIGMISYIVRIKIRVKLQKILMQQKTYPEDYSCILPPQGDTGGLFIGNLEAAQNVNTLQKHSIKAILTAAKGIDLNHSKQLIPYMFYVPANDHQSFNISPYFDKAADFIASALEKTNIMVHCLAGVSRSVSLVLSYFIKHKNYSYEQAFNLVKSKRRIIHPNDGFIAQLKSFAAKLGTTGRNRSPSPQHHYSVSPQKSSYNNYVTPDVSEFRRSNVGGSLKKHFSISQTMNQQSQIESKYKNYDYSKYQSISPYEDPKYQVASKDTSKNYESFGRIKRLSSLNIPNMQSTINDRRQSYTIFNNIENKQMSPSKHSSNVSDIDRKIEEIRKKYSDMTGYQMNYSNYRGINENKINVENNAWERWKQEGRKDFKYVPDYENIMKNRQYQQYRPPSTTAYFRDSS